MKAFCVSADRSICVSSGHYADRVDDVSTLVTLLRQSRSVRPGKIMVTSEQLDDASRLVERALLMLATRDGVSAEDARLADVHARAFLLLEDAYTELRRVVVFVRAKEGDADRIAPPLRRRTGRAL